VLSAEHGRILLDELQPVSDARLDRSQDCGPFYLCWSCCMKRPESWNVGLWGGKYKPCSRLIKGRLDRWTYWLPTEAWNIRWHALYHKTVQILRPIFHVYTFPSISIPIEQCISCHSSLVSPDIKHLLNKSCGQDSVATFKMIGRLNSYFLKFIQSAVTTIEIYVQKLTIV
jgi:hypothetical protein